MVSAITERSRLGEEPGCRECSAPLWLSKALTDLWSVSYDLQSHKGQETGWRCTQEFIKYSQDNVVQML